MAKKLNFTSVSLLNYEFTPNVKGYDPLQVDETFDLVISDLRYYENFKSEASDYIQKLENELRELKKANKEYEIEIARLKSRLSNIKDDAVVSKENVELLNYITKLENALYKKGVDPSKI